MTESWHEEITAKMGGKAHYGRGVLPNLFLGQNKEHQRRQRTITERATITQKIESLYEPRFITDPATCEFIESLIVMTDSRNILEIGMHVGFGTLHMLRAIIGSDARLTSIDARPTHDVEWWSQWPQFSFVNGWTPDILGQFPDGSFDLVFVDSQHDLEGTIKEFNTVLRVTRPGSILLFHDLPEWIHPQNRQSVPIRTWLEETVKDGKLKGLCLPSREQLDCLTSFGDGYDKKCNPGIGVFSRL